MTADASTGDFESSSLKREAGTEIALPPSIYTEEEFIVAGNSTGADSNRPESAIPA